MSKTDQAPAPNGGATLLLTVLEHDRGVTAALAAARSARDEFVDVLARELPPSIRARVVDCLRAVSGLEALGEALNEGLVREAKYEAEDEAGGGE